MYAVVVVYIYVKTKNEFLSMRETIYILCVVYLLYADSAWSYNFIAIALLINMNLNFYSNV